VSDGGRFAPLADAWATRTDGRPWYAFNDLHAIMALVGAGRIAEAEGVVERLAGYVHCGGPGTNVAMTAEVDLPASRAIIRFAQERYADVIDELLPVRRLIQRFGGSHAQRDVLQRTLLEASADVPVHLRCVRGKSEPHRNTPLDPRRTSRGQGPVGP
jgi:hypothetical protein